MLTELLAGRARTRTTAVSHGRTGTLVHLAAAMLALLMAGAADADEFQLTLGGGPSPAADQTHYSVGADYRFFTFERSSRQHLSIGASFTYVGSNADRDDSLYAVSIYPQLTLLADERSWGKPFFFVRALGPSYISARRLGEQRQANHFTFQAQVGAGVYFGFNDGRSGFISLSWKHFSNADLFSPNDSIDVPAVLSIGTRF